MKFSRRYVILYIVSVLQVFISSNLDLLIVAKDFRSYKDLVKIHDPKEPAVNNFSCEWRFPDDEDFDFSEKVLDTFFHKIRHNFESEYFKDDAYRI